MGGKNEWKPCPVCGELMGRHSDQCRTCWLKEHGPKKCAECDNLVKQKTSTLCRECWRKHKHEEQNRPTCQDCGTQISWGARGKEVPKRCMACENKRRHDDRVIVNLERQRALRADADPESRATRTMRSRSRPLKALLAPLPCVICGYTKARSRRIHRVAPALGYVWGNITHICSNCHDEIHDGITPCPDADTLEWYLRVQNDK